MPTTRSVTDPPPLSELPGRPCPIAAGLEVVGERWALLVVRELWLGAGKFDEIVRGTGAPRDRIAARLRSLEAAGVVDREVYQRHPERFTYSLTPAGRALAPVLRALGDWGMEHAVAPDDADRRHYERYRSTRVARAQSPTPPAATTAATTEESP